MKITEIGYSYAIFYIISEPVARLTVSDDNIESFEIFYTQVWCYRGVNHPGCIAIRKSPGHPPTELLELYFLDELWKTAIIECWTEDRNVVSAHLETYSFIQDSSLAATAIEETYVDKSDFQTVQPSG